MVGFKFIGDPNDDNSGPSRMTVFGHTFRRDRFTPVTDEKVIAKLRAHNHFAEEGKEEEAPPQAEKTMQELREILDSRDVEYQGNASRAKLMDLINGSGGMPDEEDEDPQA